MPRSLDENDYIQMALIYALIWAHTKDLHQLDESDLHEMMPRFERELTKRDVEYPPFYQDCATEQYPEIFNAIIQAITHGFLGLNMRSRCSRVEADFRRVAQTEKLVTPADWPKIFEAAEAASQAHRWHKLDDDLEVSPKPAT